MKTPSSLCRALVTATVTLVLTVGGLVVGAASASAAPACDDRDDSVFDAEPTTEDYLSGRVCPPNDFPYPPNVIDTDAGMRAVDPYTDGCSGPGLIVRTEALTFNRWNACATHDYGYDLWRFRTVGLNVNEVDNIFFSDMMADCRDRPLLARQSCEISARRYYEGVKTFGIPKIGDLEGIETPFG